MPMGRPVDYFPGPENRAEHYRALAKEVIRQAQGTFDNQRRAEFLAMAASWFGLAVDAECAIRKEVAAEFGQTGVAQCETINAPEVGEQAKTEIQS
jgi:hypothetical protein